MGRACGSERCRVQWRCASTRCRASAPSPPCPSTRHAHARHMGNSNDASQLVPHGKAVVRALLSALDDHKRLVRAEAVKCRAQWHVPAISACSLMWPWQDRRPVSPALCSHAAFECTIETFWRMAAKLVGDLWLALESKGGAEDVRVLSATLNRSVMRQGRRRD